MATPTAAPIRRPIDGCPHRMPMIAPAMTEIAMMKPPARDALGVDAAMPSFAMRQAKAPVLNSATSPVTHRESPPVPPVPFQENRPVSAFGEPPIHHCMPWIRLLCESWHAP